MDQDEKKDLSKEKKKIKTSTGLIAIFATVVIFFGGALTYWTYNDPNSYSTSTDATFITTKSNVEPYVGILEGDNYVIYNIDKNNTKQKVLSIPFKAGNPMKPSISKDGSIIIYSDKDYNLIKYDVATKNPTKILTSSHPENNAGEWKSYTGVVISPNNDKIAVYWSGWEWSGIAIANIDGSEFHNIKPSNSGMQLDGFSWSPDGKSFVIAGANNDFGGEPGGLYIAQTSDPDNGKQVVPESPNSIYKYKDTSSPAWSPDGKNIAFGYQYLDTVQNDNGKSYKYRGIYLVNSDGLNFRQLTDNQSYSANPVWADNDNIIYGISNFAAGNSKGIYKIGKDGKNNVELYSADYNSYFSLAVYNNKIIYIGGNQTEVSDLGSGKAKSTVYLLDVDKKTTSLIQENMDNYYEANFLGFVNVR